MKKIKEKIEINNILETASTSLMLVINHFSNLQKDKISAIKNKMV
ncbi:MAG: hypothetical protein JWR18_1666 [Segetibacter sp.]|jgi:hypothetical protein|nr:hypothetical protein [Segetibacter sp.]